MKSAQQLESFEEKWGAGEYPSIAPAWADVTPFHAISAANRKIIYTTERRGNAEDQGLFPGREAVKKLIFLVIRNFEKGGRAVREWVEACISSP